MPVNSYFIALIAIATIIRLGLVVAGPMEARDKAAKAGQWIIGMVCVVIAWIALGEIWGVETNGFHGRAVRETNKTRYNDDKDSDPNYYGSDYNEDTKQTPITVNPNP